MRRGEVWWSGARVPAETQKRRPMLVVSADAFNLHDGYRKIMVVHLSTVRRAGGPFDWEVCLPRGTAGLQHTSTAKCGEVYTLWKDQLGELAGTVPKELMHDIDRALAVALALPAA